MKQTGERHHGRAVRRWTLVVGVAGLVLLVSCTHLGYYSQSVLGGARVLMKRRPVDRVIADSATPEDLRRRRELALEMRQFAVSQLGLPDNSSYRSYSDLDRPYVLWDVVAAPELSLAAKAWCFLIVFPRRIFLWGFRTPGAGVGRQPDS